jgi:hypothetical protein
MADRSRRRLLNLFMRETRDEVDYLMRRRRANSIRAWDNRKVPTQGRIYVSNRIPRSFAQSLAPRLGPYIS